MHEFVRPELVDGVLDELYERDEQPPRMRPIDDQPLQQHPGDLLLHGFRVRLGEQVEQTAREVVREAVRVAQLVRDRVQEQVSVCGRLHNGELHNS